MYLIKLFKMCIVQILYLLGEGFSSGDSGSAILNSVQLTPLCVLRRLYPVKFFSTFENNRINGEMFL